MHDALSNIEVHEIGEVLQEKKNKRFLSNIVLLLILTPLTCSNSINSWMVHEGALFAHKDLSFKAVERWWGYALSGEGRGQLDIKSVRRKGWSVGEKGIFIYPLRLCSKQQYRIQYEGT